MTTDKYNDLPWDEGLAKADEAIGRGATLYQKYTCEKCGSRQTMSEPNTFYPAGECEECKHTTDIKRKGFGYMATFNMGQKLPF